MTDLIQIIKLGQESGGFHQNVKYEDNSIEINTENSAWETFIYK